MWTERELKHIERLRYRVRVMEAEGYSREAVFANISPRESRFLSPDSRMEWRRQRTLNKQTGRIFALRNNPQPLGLSVNVG